MVNAVDVQDLKKVASTFDKIDHKISFEEALTVLVNMDVSDKAYSFGKESVEISYYSRKPDDLFYTDEVVDHIRTALSTVGVDLEF